MAGVNRYHRFDLNNQGEPPEAGSVIGAGVPTNEENGGDPDVQVSDTVMNFRTLQASQNGGTDDGGEEATYDSSFWFAEGYSPIRKTFGMKQKNLKFFRLNESGEGVEERDGTVGIGTQRTAEKIILNGDNQDELVGWEDYGNRVPNENARVLMEAKDRGKSSTGKRELVFKNYYVGSMERLGDMGIMPDLTRIYIDLTQPLKFKENNEKDRLEYKRQFIERTIEEYKKAKVVRKKFGENGVTEEGKPVNLSSVTESLVIDDPERKERTVVFGKKKWLNPSMGVRASIFVSNRVEGVTEDWLREVEQYSKNKGITVTLMFEKNSRMRLTSLDRKTQELFRRMLEEERMVIVGGNHGKFEEVTHEHKALKVNRKKTDEVMMELCEGIDYENRQKIIGSNNETLDELTGVKSEKVFRKADHKVKGHKKRVEERRKRNEYGKLMPGMQK